LKKVDESYEEVLPISDNQEMSWRWSKEKFQNELHNLIVKRSVNGISIYKKQRSQDNDKPTKKPKTIFNKPEYSSGNGTQIIKSLFNGKVFDFPKPISLIYDFLTIGTRNNDLILDFFSGSATTAHAVMQLNSEDGGDRKYICVQIPEPTDEKSEAFKAGYKNICEIGKERIRRAGEKIKADNKDKDLANLDTGFKVFKLDSSNIKEWDSDFDNLEQNLMDATENIKTDRSSEDVLYEILLKYGLDLTLPIEEKTIDGKKVFIIGFGALVVCLDDDITTDIVESIAKLKEEYEAETIRVVFKDSSFKNAVIKTNAIQILKQYGIDEVVSV
jgi:adenine-specific DNA-methyltransferase